MYEETLLQLSKDPRFRVSESIPTPLSERRNPACGDEVALQADISNNKIRNLKFQAQGCAVCVASASAMCELLNECDHVSAKNRIEQAMSFFEGDTEWGQDWGTKAIPALGAVRARPMRMTCVRLAWEALREVL
jgi:nitrogen fixation NifU-like protein